MSTLWIWEMAATVGFTLIYSIWNLIKVLNSDKSFDTPGLH